MPLLRLALALLLLASPATAQKVDPPVAAPDGLEFFEGTDPTMNAAILEAQRSLPGFLTEVLDENGIAQTGSLKVAFQTFPEDLGNEIIWVGNFRQLPDGSFEGFLNNQPFNLGNWSQGDRVTFPRGAIRDWSLPAPEGLYGNFTTRVIAAQPGNEYLWQSLTSNPIPANWP
ncbi:DUF2314 domain-containing protein [Gymnodinialimonas hymeniacidonis]|uniref:DUF2314 domain-containing protein n=1 Tax=Gymnodinialimonas hymeniacidonis TaxID=3126508 RepID=UPI0034C5EFDE